MVDHKKWTSNFINKTVNCIVSTIATGDPTEVYITDPEGEKMKIRSYLNHQFCVKTDISLQSKKPIWEVIGNTIAKCFED